MTWTLLIQNGDLVYDQVSGQPRKVTGARKLAQELGEMLTVDEQPDGFGAGLRSLLGTLSDEDDSGGVSMLVSRNIRRATERFIQLQQDSAARLVRTDEERLTGLAFVDVEQKANRTDYRFRAEFRSAAKGPNLARSGVISTQRR